MKDRTVVAHSCRRTKKIICGMEGENVVAYGRLPSPAHQAELFIFFPEILFKYENQF